jgi:sterol desaturase/sphingolipid hydroxylase (fatty acid hydroxylase superfamily)
MLTPKNTVYVESLINYFETIPSLHRTLILVGGLTFFWLLESAVPLFRFHYNKWKHASLNIFFTLTTIVANFVLAFTLVKTSDWATSHQFGFLYWLSLDGWIFLIAGLLLLDLISAYFIHWLEHKVKWMWQFHIIHHSDKEIDTTSANRHHPGESVFRLVFTVLAVLLIGAPIWLIFLYQTMSVVLTQFNHANIKMPGWLDTMLMTVFVTPNMHRVHHHYRQPYTDSNYGNIFSFWDRIFGTYKAAPNEKLIYGVDTMMESEKTDNIMALMKKPFTTYIASPVYEKEELLEK